MKQIPSNEPEGQLRLTTRQTTWLFEAAGEHFSKEIERLEMEIVRHKQTCQLTDQLDEFVHRANMVRITRRARIIECETFLKEYIQIVEFCRQAKIKCVDRNAQEFAEAFSHLFKK